MALRAILLRNKLDTKNKALEALRAKDAEIEKREQELEAAINEMTDETSEEDRKVVEKQVEEFQLEKEGHEKEKKALEEEISETENEIKKEEEKKPEPAAPEGGDR